MVDVNQISLGDFSWVIYVAHRIFVNWQIDIQYNVWLQYSTVQYKFIV